MFHGSLSPVRFLIIIGALVLLVLLLLLLACDVEEATERPTREPQNTATQTPDEEPTEPPTPTLTVAPTPTTSPTLTPTPTLTAPPAPTATVPPVATVPAPTATRPAPVPTRAPTATPFPTAVAARPQSLESYAAEFAGGPGAVYVGDLRQLAGPAPVPGLGDRNGQVPLDSLQRHSWIYESDYYRSLLEKASVTNPTQLTSSGEQLNIQFVCINRALLPCRLYESYFAPNVLARTNGQVRFNITSYPELGVAGPNAINLVSDGSLTSATIYSGYATGEIPALEIQTLYGIHSSAEGSYQAAASMVGDLDQLIEDGTRGGVIFSHGWYAGSDQYLFCRDSVESRSDLQGRRTRSHSASLPDWLTGMGAQAQFVAFAEVYSAFARGILDCAVTGGVPGYGQRWHEVSDYIAGPIYSVTAQANVINSDFWNRIPSDLQRIILEEGVKMELEALRLAPIQNEVGLPKLLEAGMEYTPFSSELQQLSRQSVINQVIPNWIRRLGDARDPIITETFNNKVGPIVGMRIEADGTVTDLGGTTPTVSTPRPTPAPTQTATEAETETATRPAPQELVPYATLNAGGPGAIYVGDLSQLAGPAPVRDLGDDRGNVPLDSLERHSWIYESGYYWELLDRARWANPTRLTSSGEGFNIQFACINRGLLPCKLMENYFASNVLDRTNGQVRFEVSSFPELGLAGPDTLDLVADGTLPAGTVYGGYAAGSIPALSIQSLWGSASSPEESYRAAALMVSDLDRLVADGTGGGQIISHSWYAGQDQFLFCREAIESPSDFYGKTTRSHVATLSNWIKAMGGEAQELGFGDVYTWIERNRLDCAITKAVTGHGQRWYEVADYVMGPIYNIQANGNVIGRDLWNSIPADLQQIILEEGAKLELEALRLASIQNEVGMTRLRDAGMEYLPFSPQLQQLSRKAATGGVIPGWLKAVGDTSNPIITDTFNGKLGPIVGMRIESDGTVTDLR